MKVGPFSVAAALEHLRDLEPEGRARAARYIARAPAYVRTPLRCAVEKEPWHRRLIG